MTDRVPVKAHRPRFALGRLFRAVRRAKLRSTLATLLTAVVLAIIGDIVSDLLPEQVKQVLTAVALATIGLILVLLIFGSVADPRQPAAEVAAPSLKPITPWRPSRLDLCGRHTEIARAIQIARTRGVVGIVGPRDAGTSAVASQVLRALPADPDPVSGGPGWYRLDLRGRSSQRPAKAREVAARLLAGFGLAQPASANPETLRAAAQRLAERLRGRRVVLLLDEAFEPDQVRWLVEEVDQPDRPTVVVAGEEAVAAAFAEAELVRVGPLDEASAAQLLRSRLDAQQRRSRLDGRLRVPPGQPAWRAGLAGLWSRWRLELPELRSERWSQPRPDRSEHPANWHLQIVRACLCLPRVIVDVAEELSRDGSEWTLAEFADAMVHPDPALHGTDNPTVRVRKKILDRMLPSLSSEAQELMAALAGLTVTELPAAALAELSPNRDNDALSELEARHLVRSVPPDRYRMPEEVRLAVRYGVAGDQVDSAAARATACLVGYYAELAETTAAELSARDTGASATDWFATEAPLLAALLAAPALPGLDVGLGRIADALEVWYLRTGDADGLDELARAQATAATSAETQALARLRLSNACRLAGRVAQAEQALAELAERLPPALDVRRHNAWALLRLAQQPAEPVVVESDLARERLIEAERSLQRCLDLLPKADLAGHMCVQINLGAVRLRGGDLGAAKTHLLHAVGLARHAGDDSGWAQGKELLGIVDWCNGAPGEAVNSWTEAARVFEQLAETRALNRCRAHLATEPEPVR